MSASMIDDFLGTRPSGIWRQRLLWLLLGLALFALIVLGGRFVNGGAATRYATTSVGRADLRAEVAGNGALQPAGRQTAGAAEAGLIATVLVQDREQVSKGQLLAQLDTTPVEQEIARATTLLDARQTALVSAQAQAADQRARLANYQRVRAESGGLAPSDREMALARQDLGRALANLQTARIEMDAATRHVADSQGRLALTEIRSPIDGVIIRRPQPGQGAHRGQNDLFEIAAPYSQLRLEIMVRRAEADGLHVGAKAQVRAGSRQAHPATVVDMRPARSADASRLIIVLDVANPRLELQPGMSATASIDLGVRRQALVVPDAALRFAQASDASRGLEDAKGDAVYVLDPQGAPRRVAVKVEGGGGDGRAVTSDELSPGAPVITGLR